MIRPELLAPAGDLNRLKIAFMYGADAVYIGSKYNLRANANNFSLTDIKHGVEYAHKLGKKVYVAVNIVLHNKELEDVKKYLFELYKIKVDAIIISDPALIEPAKKVGLIIHLSTQNSTLNKEAVSFWKKQGVSRIVLARECERDDILDIKKSVDIELEVFIHGAICASYSGRCVLSNYLTNRDSNRGGCSQICRWDFDLYDDEVIIKGEKPFTFCTKDLSLIKYIPDLINMKVDSLKIEGRMRSVYYLATVLKIYKAVIDDYVNNPCAYTYNLENECILRRCANRDSICQFFNGIYDETVQYYNGRQEITNQDFLGIVVSYDNKRKLAKIEQRNHFKRGDKIIIFGPNDQFLITVDKMYDENMKMIDRAPHPKQIVYIPVLFEIKENYILKKC